MIYIFSAFYAEAKNIIEHYGLKKEKSPEMVRFDVFANESIRLVITGVGEINAAAAKLQRLLCGVPMQTAKKTFWIFCRKILPCCRIHLVQEMQKKPFGLHGFPENWAAVIL